MQTLMLTSLRNIHRILASSAALLALSILLATAGRAATEMTTENGTNRPGMDYRHFEIVPRGPSIAGDGVTERCREACEKDKQCGSYTAVKPGVQSPKNGVCWLKNKRTTAVADSCCTSGIKIVATGKPRPPGTSPAPGTPPASPGSDPDSVVPAEWADMLNVHNSKRQMHCAPKLTWSNKLAEEAQKWAEGCTNQHSSAGQGENLAFFTPTATNTDAFQKSWYCEIKWYDFNNPKLVGGFKKGCDAPVNAHFTQVVWKDSTKLGCGKKTCTINGSTGTYFVCRYTPPGNFNASDPNVLKAQVSAPKC